jgi:polyvinyl alcohol dehydrogenase (cytochrome)
MYNYRVKLCTLMVLMCCPAVFAQNGAALYKEHCAKCHDAPTARTPPFSALRSMSSNFILRVMETGAMKMEAKDLTSQERVALSSYLSGGMFKGAKAAEPPPQSAYCAADATPSADASKRPSWNGFGAGLTNARFQGSEAAGIKASDVGKLRVKWAFRLSEAMLARGQPVVVGNRLFAPNQANQLYSLDAKSGCLYWIFDSETPVRSGVIAGPAGGPGARPALFFGDGAANAYAVDFATGKLLWKTHVEDHYAAMTTPIPNLYQGVLYFGVSSVEEVTGAMPTYECCTFRGSVVALDARTGKQIWKTYTIAQTPQPTKKTEKGVQRWGPSGAGVWSTPTVDTKRDAIYVSTGDNYSDPPTRTSDAVLALDRATGKLLWSRQMTSNDAFTVDCPQPNKTNCPESNGPDFDFGQPPILVSLPNGKRALVIGQKSGIAHALDPDQEGEVLWQTRLGKGGALGGIQWGSAVDQENMYAAVSDITFGRPDPDNPGKFKMGLDPTKGGGVFALRLGTGEKVWSAPAPLACGTRANCSPAQSAAVTAIPGAVFSGSVDGHLRAYSSATGEIVWDFDTVREYDAINGGKAKGGSLDAGGAAVVDGMLYVTSGYGQFGGIGGNVLLAFSVDGK